jgi:hypothetical protein
MEKAFSKEVSAANSACWDHLSNNRVLIIAGFLFSANCGGEVSGIESGV